MSQVELIVRMNMEPHSFVSTPSEARAALYNMLHRDPRFKLYEMEVDLSSDTNDQHNVFEGARGRFSHEDVAAWRETGGGR